MAGTRPIRKVLIANRGEIAVRIMRSLRELGICSVAVFSEADRDALHVRYADEAYCIGPAASTESYLVVEKLLDVASQCGADAVHPGYGFLSERSHFAKAVADAGLIWIGPPPDAIDAMGDKVTARDLMSKAGVPVVPGTPGAIADPAEARQAAQEIGFPVLIKASAGGGGKGMRRVDDEADFEEAFNAASREAAAAFGRGDCYIEKFILNPKHVEFQVLCDVHGNALHLFERDCSVQRRHQKVIEETPCPVLRPEVRAEMGRIAVRAAQAASYVNAGTIEFLLDSDQKFYFLEMNTRLQVEHPITELCTGVDLVALQIKVAEGEPLGFVQADLSSRGAAIEVRIYAEDPNNNFLPSPGKIDHLLFPDGPGVRVDSGVYEGFTVPIYYDPLLAKLIVWADTRPAAIARLERALSELTITGVRSNVDFLRRILGHESFRDGSYDIGLVERDYDALIAVESNDEVDTVAIIAGLASVLKREEDRAGGVGGATACRDGRDHSRWRDHGRLRQLGKL